MLPIDRKVMSSNARNRIFAIVLAGGTASRFGRLKQIEPFDDTCLLGVVVGNALMCEEIERVILVLGAEADSVKRTLGDFTQNEKLEIVINNEYQKGLSTSLRAGLEKAMTHNCDAVAFLLGDMPMIDAAFLNMVIERYRTSECKICYVITDGHPGHPIIANKDLFDEFLNIKGDIGGREVVRNNIEWALEVDVDENSGNHQLDIDTVKDMEVYRSLFRLRRRQ